MTNHTLRAIYDWASNTPSESLPILLLGLDSSGKTTLLEQLKWLRLGTGLPLSTVQRTIGLNVARLPHPQRNLLIWDLSGDASLRPLWNNYLGSAAAFIYLIDSSDTARSAEAVRVLQEVLASPETAGKPFLVVLNKSDLSFASEWSELLEPIEDKYHLSGFRVVTLSAISTPQLVDRSLDWLISVALKTP